MPLRIYPVIAVLLMLLFAGNHEARAQDTCATAVAIEHDSTHSITMLPGIDRVWLTFTTDSTAEYLAFTPGLDFTGFDTIIVYTGNCGQLNHHLSVGSTDSVVMIHFIDTVQQYFIEIVRSSVSDTGQIIVLNPPSPWPFATTASGVCNLLSNSNFETLNPVPGNIAYVTTNTNNEIGTSPFEFNILTDWSFAWGTPSISPNTLWNPIDNHTVFLWSTYSGIQSIYLGEGIFQDFYGLQDSRRYKLLVDLKDGGIDQTIWDPTLFVAEFTNDYNATPPPTSTFITAKPLGYQNLFSITGANPSQLPNLNTQSYTTYEFPFVFSSTYYANSTTGITRLTLYNHPPVVVGENTRSVLLLDNVKIIPDEQISEIIEVKGCAVRLKCELSGFYPNVIYQWSATLSNNSQVSGSGNIIDFELVDLPASVIVTAIYHNGECQIVKSIQVPEITMQNIDVDDLVLCYPTTSAQLNATITGGTPPYYFTWHDPDNYLSSIHVSNPIFSAPTPGTYIFDVNAVDANGSTYCGQATVFYVNELETPEIVGKRSICDDLPALQTYQIVNPSSHLTYNWYLDQGNGDAVFVGNTTGEHVFVRFNNMPSLPEYMTLTAIVEQGTDCEKVTTYRIYDCCQIGDTAFNDATILPNMLINHSSILLQGVTTIASSITFSNMYVYMGPEAVINILPGSDLTISLQTPTSFDMVSQGCEVMWDGIYVNDPTASVAIDNTTIKDAFNAIVSQYGGEFTLNDVIFEDNYVGLDVIDYHAGISSYTGQPFPGSINGTKFWGQNPTTYELIFAPMVGTPVFCGIRTNGVNDLTIDGGNVFENMEYGIYALNSYLSCYNNRFENIKPQSGPYSLATNKPKGAVSSYFEQNSTLPIDRILNVGSQQSGFSNEFIDCEVGIDAFNLKLIAKNNLFDNMDRMAILLTHIGSGTLIENNSITGAHTGIRAVNLFPSANAIDIAGNEIADVVTGILTINAGIHGLVTPLSGYYLRIYNNDILLKETADQIIKTGIFINNCPFANVSCNNIYRVNPPTSLLKRNVRGIWCSHTMHASIYDNWTNKLGAGIYTTGIQTNTRYYCNNLHAGHHGFFFGLYTLMTNQGWKTPTSGWNTHNIFNQQTGSKLAMDEGNIINPVGPTGSKIKWYYFDNQGQQYMPEIPITQYIEDFFDDDPNINAVHACGTSQQAPHCPLPSPTPYLVGNLTVDDRDQLFADLLYMEEVYLQLNEEYHGYTSEYLYTVLFNDSSLMYLGGDLDNEYRAFYDSLRNVPISSFVEVEMLFNEGDYYAAGGVNTSIAPRNNLEEYRQMVNDILFSTWIKGQYHFTPEDSASLLAIATLTPYEGGYAVYTARVMLGIDPQDHEVAYRKPAPQTHQKQELVKLYPNPTRELVTVEFIEEIDLKHCFIEFYSVHGQKLLAEPLQNLNQTFSVTALPNGIHFYRVVNNSRVVQTGKLAVRP